MLIPVICKRQNRKEMFLWAKLYCKVPQVSKINELNSCLTEFFFQKIISKIFIPVNSSFAREREGKGYILPFPLSMYRFAKLHAMYRFEKLKREIMKKLVTWKVHIFSFKVRYIKLITIFYELFQRHLLFCTFKSIFMQLCKKTMMLFYFFST